jgi:hypothetical protein
MTAFKKPHSPIRNDKAVPKKQRPELLKERPPAIPAARKSASPVRKSKTDPKKQQPKKA